MGNSSSSDLEAEAATPLAGSFDVLERCCASLGPRFPWLSTLVFGADLRIPLSLVSIDLRRQCLQLWKLQFGLMQLSSHRRDFRNDALTIPHEELWLKGNCFLAKTLDLSVPEKERFDRNGCHNLFRVHGSALLWILEVREETYMNGDKKTDTNIWYNNF